jgi:tetratricopeptide (TPR) repeat protein
MSSPPRITIQLFDGPRIVTQDGRVLTFQEKPGAILALLALAPNNRLSRERLREAIWPDEDGEATRGRLRTALSALRTSIPHGNDLLPPNSQTVSLNREAGLVLDIEEFDRLLAGARAAATAEEQIELLSQADALYAGPLCPRIYIDGAVRARDRYEQKIEEVRRCLHELVDARDASEPILPAPLAPCPDAREEPATPGEAPLPSAKRKREFGWRATLFVAAAAAGLLLWFFLRPAPTVEERISRLAALRHAGRRAESEAQLRQRMHQRVEELIPLAEEASKTWYGPDEKAMIDAIKSSDDVIKETLSWLVDEDPEKALQLTGALSRYWSVRERMQDALVYLEPALQRVHGVDPQVLARAKGLHAMGILVSEHLRTPRARKANQQALSEIQEAHALYVQAGDRRGQAHALRCKGHVLHALENDAEAAKAFEQAFDIFRKIDDRTGEPPTYWGMCLLRFPGEMELTHHLRSARCILNCSRLYREVGCHAGLADSVKYLHAHIPERFLDTDQMTNPRVTVLLREYDEDCKWRIGQLHPTEDQKEIVELRQYRARVAMGLKDKQTVVEQLGYLLSPNGDPELARTAAYLDVADAYLCNIHETPKPPLTAFSVQQTLLLNRKSGRIPKHLSLEAAVDLATK